MKNRIFISALFLSLSSFAGRNPAGELTPPDLRDLAFGSEEILKDVSDSEFAKFCVPYLKALEVKIDRVNMLKVDLKQLQKDGEKIAETSWQIRQKLHSDLENYSLACVEKIQTTFRQLRFVEDYFLEFARKVEHKDPSAIDFLHQPSTPIKDHVPYFSFKGHGTFRPGDLFISRGLSFLSAMIARMGKRPTQFSHVVMLNQDPKTTHIRTIESYVGAGVGFYNFSYALKNENGRILWLRAKNQAMGEKASQLMGQLVTSRLAKNDPIKYDYDLDFKDHSTMSCAEVSQAAFEMASLGKFKIPFYPNEISKGQGLIDKLKLVKGATFEPGDMEIDPRFTLVGEFRDLRVTRDSRQKDAIMSAVFSWMDKYGYVLNDNLKAKMAGGVIWGVRKTYLWPVVKKMLKLEDFSKEIPPRMLKTMSLINDLGVGMVTELKKRDDAFLKAHGIPMTYVDLMRELEKMRLEDWKIYQDKKTQDQSYIHHILRK